MLKILPQITFGQKQITQKPRAATAPALERTPKHDYVSFGSNDKIALAKKYLERAERLTLADNLMKSVCPEANFYELPTNFFFAMKNNPSHHIIQKVPNIIQNCGLPLDTALKKLDKIANLVRLTYNDVDYSSFKLGDKIIQAKKIVPKAGGNLGLVYHCKSGDEDFALKIFKQPKGVSHHGIWGEVAIAREFERAKVNDTAQMFLASPHPHVGWMISQFVTDQTKIPFPQRPHEKFLQRHGLTMGDPIAENYIQGAQNKPIRVDLGGVTGSAGNIPIYFSTEMRQKYMTDPNLLNLAEDEGTRISALKSYMENTPSPDYSNGIMKTPEAKLVQAMVDPKQFQNMTKEHYEGLVKAIDVVGDTKFLW